MRRYRVVVIDDDSEVLRRLRLTTWKREFEGETWIIELMPLHVQLESDDSGSYQFTTGTIAELGNRFRLKPDLILADYGFIEPSVLSYWLQRHSEGHSITADDLRGQYLTPVELVSTVQSATTAGNLDSSVVYDLQCNFLQFDRKMILYSMPSEAFVAALGAVEFRRSRTEPAFPLAKVRAIDTKDELYDRDAFAKSHNPAFYAHLVSGLIDKQVQIGLLETMLDHARSLKYVRFRRSTVAVGAIVALGGGVAALGEFIGERLMGLLRMGDYENAAVVAAAALMLIFVVGISLPYAFGRFMSGLLDPGRQDSTRDDHA